MGIRRVVGQENWGLSGRDDFTFVPSGAGMAWISNPLRKKWGWGWETNIHPSPPAILTSLSHETQFFAEKETIQGKMNIT